MISIESCVLLGRQPRASLELNLNDASGQSRKLMGHIDRDAGQGPGLGCTEPWVSGPSVGSFLGRASLVLL